MTYYPLSTLYSLLSTLYAHSIFNKLTSSFFIHYLKATILD